MTKLIPAEKLEALQSHQLIVGIDRFGNDDYADVVLKSDLRALIDAEPEAESVADDSYQEGTAERLRLICSKLGIGAPVSNEEIMLCQFSLLGSIRRKIDEIYIPPPDLTKLVGELVEALEDANKKLRKAKDFEYESQEYISESYYELNGFLGSVSAEISVSWQKVIDANDELLKRAKEVVK